MNKLDKQYIELLQTILKHGVFKEDRTGTGTQSIFGYTIRHNMAEGFPLLTTKKMPWKSIVSELMWFLNGETNIKFLLDRNCKIWNGDCYKNYVTHNQFNSNPKWLKSIPLDNGFFGAGLYSEDEFIDKIKNDDEFAKKWGDMGPIYGKQWRKWEYGEEKAIKNGQTYPNGEFKYGVQRQFVDQIQNLINDLITNPDSRRLMVNAWNPGELKEMVLPPCHYGFQLYTTQMSPTEIVEQAKKDGLWEDGSGFDAPDEFSKNSEGLLFHEFIAQKQNQFKTRKISLMWNQRSVDVPLGLPFNIASYGILLSLLGEIVNMVPDQLIGNLGDSHIYLNQISGVETQIKRNSHSLAVLKINTKNWINSSNIDELMKSFETSDFKIENYTSEEKIIFPLSN